METDAAQVQPDDDGEVTVVVEFSLSAPDHAHQLAGDVAKGIAQTFTSRPGFRSATLLVSTDGRRMLNVARWSSEQDWLAATSGPEQEHPATEPGRDAGWLQRRAADEPVAQTLATGGASLDRVAAFRPVRTVSSTTAQE